MSYASDLAATNAYNIQNFLIPLSQQLGFTPQTFGVNSFEDLGKVPHLLPELINGLWGDTVASGTDYSTGAFDDYDSTTVQEKISKAAQTVKSVLANPAPWAEKDLANMAWQYGYNLRNFPGQYDAQSKDALQYASEIAKQYGVDPSKISSDIIQNYEQGYSRSNTASYGGSLLGDFLNAFGLGGAAKDLAPVFSIVSAYFLPIIGGEIASALSVDAALGNALASVGLQTAQGVPLDKAIENAAVNAGTQVGAQNLAANLNNILKDPKLANVITSVGASTVKTALQGGSSSDIAKAAGGALVGSTITETTGSKVAGTVGGGLASGGNATTILTGVGGVLGNATTNTANTTTTTTGVTTPDPATLDATAKSAGFPDYATYQQYAGNYDKYFQDIFSGKVLPEGFGNVVGSPVAGVGDTTPGGGAGVTKPGWLNLGAGETTIGSVKTDIEGNQEIYVFRPDPNDPTKGLTYLAQYDKATGGTSYTWQVPVDPNDPTKGVRIINRDTPPEPPKPPETTITGGDSNVSTGGVDTGNATSNVVTITSTQGNGIPDKNTQVSGGNVTIDTGGVTGNVPGGNVVITGGGGNVISNITPITGGGPIDVGGNVTTGGGNVTVSGGDTGVGNVVVSGGGDNLGNVSTGNVVVSGGGGVDTGNVATGNVTIGGIDTGIGKGVGFGGGTDTGNVTVGGGGVDTGNVTVGGGDVGNVTVGGVDTGNVTTGNVTVGTGGKDTGNVTGNVTTETTYKPELFITGGVTPKISSGQVLAQVLGTQPYTSLPTFGLTTGRGAGEIESSETGGKRRNVWNEASLRLKDALGL